MTKLKYLLSTSTLLIAAIMFGQGSFSNIDNHTNPLLNTVSTENIILSPKEKIDVNLDKMMTDPVLKNANWGFVLYDPKTKKIISAYNENTPLVPASTTKLLTTETALDLLGENFQWSTQLEYAGTIDETGTLNGNLYIVGSGDPSLGSAKAGSLGYTALISDFTSKLQQLGIKKITGDIVIQSAVFKDNKSSVLPANIVWMENANYYLPVGSTSEVDPRKEKLVVKQGNPFSETKKYFYVSPYTQKMVFAEDYNGSYLSTKLPDAPAYLANNLRAKLLKSGIGIVGKVITKMMDPSPEIRKVISTYKSPTLQEIIYYTNKHSDNALAEALLRTVGFQKNGDQTVESGKKTVIEHLQQSGFDTTGFSYVDGSGLSRSNTVTPFAQVKFLTSLMNKNYFKTYLESLPIGGQDGTLKKMFLGNGYGSVFAKTGTLNKVKTLAGYIKTQSGKTLVFSLLVNNYAGSVDQVKSRMEWILDPVLSY